MHKAVVITTINPKTLGVQKFEECEGWITILIGDKKSTDIKTTKNCIYLSIEDQLKLEYKYTNSCPFNSYSRKNIGYLFAVKNGFDFIYDTDDDNIPYESFGENANERVNTLFINRNGWINIYNKFTDNKIWPRGFPLEKINSINTLENDKIIENKFSPVQQFLVDDNPDVDAVFRMTCELPVKFDKNKSYILNKYLWTPFNSQSTYWWERAFPLLYLPSFCSFRMTDIWRSFIAQRIMWENDWFLSFHSPMMYQKRNPHNLLNDFIDEIPGYVNNVRFIEALEKIHLKNGVDSIPDNMITCYKVLIDMGLFDKKELLLLNLWLEDLVKLNG